MVLVIINDHFQYEHPKTHFEQQSSLNKIVVGILHHMNQFCSEFYSENFGEVVACYCDGIRTSLYMPIPITNPKEIKLIMTHEKSDTVASKNGHYLAFPMIFDGEVKRFVSSNGVLSPLGDLMNQDTFNQLKSNSQFCAFLKEEWEGFRNLNNRSSVFMKNKTNNQIQSSQQKQKQQPQQQQQSTPIKESNEVVEPFLKEFDELVSTFPKGTIVYRKSLIGDYYARVNQVLVSEKKSINFVFEYVIANGKKMSWKRDHVCIPIYKGKRNTQTAFGFNLVDSVEVDKIESKKGNEWKTWLTSNVQNAYHYEGNVEVLEHIEQSKLPQWRTWSVYIKERVLVTYDSPSNNNLPDAEPNTYPMILVSPIRTMLLLQQNRWCLAHIMNLKDIQHQVNYNVFLKQYKQDVFHSIEKSLSGKSNCLILFKANDFDQLSSFLNEVDRVGYFVSAQEVGSSHRLSKILDQSSQWKLIPVIYCAQGLESIANSFPILRDYRGLVFLHVQQNTETPNKLVQLADHLVNDYFGDYRGG